MSDKNISVFLADDHTIVRQGLAKLLEGEPDLRIVGEAEIGREAVVKVEKLKPDVVLMDIAMPMLNGIEATRQIRRVCPQTKIIILSMHSHNRYISELFGLAASGYLLKSSTGMELALHNRKRNLQDGLVKAAKDMGRHVDAIFLGYGLCGNALQKPHELLADAGVPIFIPMDQDHPVDDCVGLIIGGRDCYYREQCRVAGTFFMIPGWTRHWKELFKKEYGKFDVEFTRRIFGMSNYERSLLIPNPALPVKEMRQNIAEFNHLFGFRTELLQGSLDILDKTWESAKEYLQGEKEHR